jgi:hypothetical protein
MGSLDEAPSIPLHTNYATYLCDNTLIWSLPSRLFDCFIVERHGVMRHKSAATMDQTDIRGLARKYTFQAFYMPTNMSPQRHPSR